ncbi:non-ribosomal peptide synthetase [Chitinophaga sp. HK235]|uniref:non-ribosomal peptide synthetase n=1 Tax=Chitinophaga sp. HK235 TaxID=2952571 RepID=UPI001BAD0FDD|nr:non-ribosomal peptide synthetase [Chitinophaga sp. HK235]
MNKDELLKRARNEDFWSMQLKKAGPGENRLFLNIEEVKNNAASSSEIIYLKESDTEKVRHLCNESDLLIYNFYATALHILFHFYGERKVIFLSPSTRLEETETTEKFFLMMDDIDMKESFKTLFSSRKESLLNAINHTVDRDAILALFDTRDYAGLQPVYALCVDGHVSDACKKLTQVIFHFNVSSSTPSLEIFCKRELYDEKMPELFGDNFNALLGQIISRIYEPVKDLNWMGSREQAIHDRINQSRAYFSVDKNVVELVEAHRTANATDVAIRDGDETRTYADLSANSNRLAHYLSEQHALGKGHLAGVMMPRSIQMPETILAVWKTGAAYVPMGTDLTDTSLAQIIRNSGLKVIVVNTGEALAQLSRLDIAAAVVYLNEERERINVCPDTPLNTVIHPNDLAYVIYTSGSTGEPKGVMIEHFGMVNHIGAKITEIGIKKGGIVAQNAPHTFDISVWQFFAPLVAGAQCLIYNEEEILNIGHFIAKTVENKVNVLELVPSYLLEMLHYMEAAVEKPHFALLSLILNAETLTHSMVSRWLALYPGIPIINTYGATEVSDDICHYFMTSVPGSFTVPVMYDPIQHVEVHLVNDNFERVPVGVKGEILLAGPTVGKGYLNNEEKTKAAFLAGPIAGVTRQERVYRTGDIGRLTAGGTLEFIERVDSQVKIRGHRIELGGIENIINTIPEVKNSKAIANTADQYIVLYYMSEAAIDKDVLDDALLSKLPRYMLPAIYIHLTEFPLTPNGKIDKKALPDPEQFELAAGGATYVAPRNETEEKLVAIWQEVLGKEKVGVMDDFFSLGGHSLKMMRLTGSYHKVFNVKVELADLFANTTLESHVDLIAGGSEERYTPIPLVDKASAYPLSPAQKRLWLVQQLNPSTTSYNIYAERQLQMTAEEFAAALKVLVERHEILRTKFVEEDGEPRQVIIPVEQAIWDLPVADDVYQAAEALKRHVFDLSSWPLFRLAVHRQEGGIRLLFNMHHIISDGWSTDIFVREINTIHNREAAALTPLKIQYKDYAAWQNAALSDGKLDMSRQYWVSKLSGNLPVLRLPADYSSEELRENNTGAYTLYLDQYVKALIHDFALQRKISVFSVLAACFKVLLYRLTGENDIIIGMPAANRNHEDVKDLIGFFLNTLMLRDQVDSEQPFNTLADEVGKTILEGLKHQSYPFELLLDELNVVRDQHHFPISSVFLNMLDFNAQEKEYIRDFEPVHITAASAPKFDIECYFKSYENGISLQCAYRRNLFEQPTIAYWLEEYTAIVKQVLASPDMRIKNVHVFDKVKFEQERPVPKNSFVPFEKAAIQQTIVSRFEQQVARTPQQAALVQGDNVISYQELNAKANGLAHTILSKKQIKGEHIGLLLDHGAPGVTGMLGVLKSGNIYVPLDPSHPKERLRHILEHSRCNVIIAMESTLELAASLSTAADELTVIHFSPDIISRDDRPDVEITPESPAYVLYTSGSTGIPKGVVQCHKNVLHFIRLYTNNLHIDAGDRVSLLPTYSFDSSVMDIYGALLNGATLYPYSIEKESVEHLKTWLEANEISILHTVPTIYRYFLDTLKEKDVLQHTRLVVLGGEAVFKHDVDLFKKHFPEEAIFINGYGPTESTVTIQKFIDKTTRITHRNIPVGVPCEDTTVYILNEDDEKMGIYQEGEIVYKSDYLALGYLNDETQTNKVFTPDPITKEGRVYRSGDLGMWMPTGDIVFTGRKDGQIKLNGIRIELPEIEQHLLKITGIEEAIVLKKVLKGAERLVAYIRGERELNIREIKLSLSQSLPVYMVPAHYVFLDKFPLTATGKISRRDFPEPAPEEETMSLPENPVEERLAQLWSEILKTDPSTVRTDQGLFTMGGNSIQIIRLKNKIQKDELLGVQLSLKDFFPDPTIKSLARVIQLATRLKGMEGMEIQNEFENESII